MPLKNYYSILTMIITAITMLAVAPLHAALTLIDSTTRNGSFETPASGKVSFSAKTVPFWSNWTIMDTADDDTGVESVPKDDPNRLNVHGSRVAFIQAGGAIVNMTDHIISVGDVIHYSVYNVRSHGGWTAPAKLSLVWDRAGVMTQLNGTEISVAVHTKGTGQYTVKAGDACVGHQLGIGISNTMPGWPEVDQVKLSIGEPPGAILGLGGFSLILSPSH